MNKEFEWTDAEVKKILHAATGNIKDFVMDNDGFLELFKASRTEVKRDWEIVGYYCRHETSGHIYKNNMSITEQFRGNFQNPAYWGSKGNQIHSVKRLSDNEVFSVGDKIMVHRNSGYSGQRTIERFELNDGVMKEVDELGKSRLDQISKPLQRTPDSIKPPIGIMPEYIWKEQRLYELNQAIIRYINAGLSYPKEWGMERENLIQETKSKQ